MNTMELPNKYNKLKSMEEYSLSKLFSTEGRKIIIPDFQRDYCWGDTTHGEKNDTDLVSGFLDTLLKEFKNDPESNILLGKVDVYENPENHIHLTDGQQRLTTLYLLIGILYKQTKKVELKNCLISEKPEGNYFNEPYLQYSIRESTLFFLRDLVNEFFIKDNNLSVSDIDKRPWYFNEYKLDPSIVSIINALRIIEQKIKPDNYKNNAFSAFILNKVQIQYYDVIDRKHGEERFVIINTTGKNLTISENVKPILLDEVDSKYAEPWEVRETFFWKNRDKPEEKTADHGVNDFLSWCFQIFNKKEKDNVIQASKDLLKSGKNEDFLLRTNSLFSSLCELIKFLQIEKFQAQFKFINGHKEVVGILGLRNLNAERLNNILVPLLYFIEKFKSEEEIVYTFLRRLRKNYFDDKRSERNKNYVDWRYILQMIENSDSIQDVLHFNTLNGKIKPIQNIQLHQWYNEEEVLKVKLAGHFNEMQKWEDHDDFMGDLSPLFKVAKNNLDQNVLNSFFETYVSLRNKTNKYFINPEIRNRYFLFDLYYREDWLEGTIVGWGYCMLKQNDNFPFLNDHFFEIWNLFNDETQNEESILIFLKSKIQGYFNEKVLKSGEIKIKDIMTDISIVGQYELIQIWLLLEVLFADNQQLDFSNSVACFWRYPNLLEVISNTEKSQNNYQIGNLLLGTSYSYRKFWFDYTKYPLMNELDKIKENKSITITKDFLNSRTAMYQDKLTNELFTH